MEAAPTATWSLWVRIPLSLHTGASTMTILSSRGQYPSRTIAPRSVDLWTTCAPTNQWFHIVVVSRTSRRGDGPLKLVYCNGKLMRKEIDDADQPVPGEPDFLTLGLPRNARFVIWVSDLAVFNESLHQFAVEELYAAGRPSGIPSVSPSQDRKCRFHGKPADLVTTLDGSWQFFKYEHVWGNPQKCVLNRDKSCLILYSRHLPQNWGHCFFTADTSSEGILSVDRFEYPGCEVEVEGNNYRDNELEEKIIPPGKYWFDSRRCPYSKVFFFKLCAREPFMYASQLFMNCLQANEEDANSQVLEAVLGRDNVTNCTHEAEAVSCDSSAAPFVRLCGRTCATSLASGIPPLPDWPTGATGQCQRNWSVADMQEFATNAKSEMRTVTDNPELKWEVMSGDCSVVGKCAGSPNFPLAAPANHTCSLKAPPSPVSVEVQFQAGTLEVNNAIHEELIPQRLGIASRSPVTWTGGMMNNPGWKLCATEECTYNCSSSSSALMSTSVLSTSALVSCAPTVQNCGEKVLEPTSNAICTNIRPYAQEDQCGDTSAWVQLDLHTPMQFDGVRILSCQGRSHCSRKVQVSLDGIAWWTVFTQGPAPGLPEPEDGTLLSFAREMAQYVRVWSGRSTSEPVARFLHVAVQAGECVDDQEWKSNTLGNYDLTCRLFGVYPHWCYVRGALSVEALKACPRSCGMCWQSFRPLEAGDQCSPETLIDISGMEDHVVSGLACFWHCVEHEYCTHIGWEAGRYCRRYRGCRNQPSTNDNVQFFDIPGKLDSVYPALIKWRMKMKGHYRLQPKGRCEVPFSAEDCRFAADEMGLQLDADIPGNVTACYYDAQRDTVRYSTTMSDCTYIQQCVCQTDSGLPNATVVHDFITDPNVAAIPTNIPAGLPAVSDSCRLKSSKNCRGKKRVLRLWQWPHIRLGPHVFPALMDWDRDGDVDIFLGRSTGELIYVENIHGILDLTAAVGLSHTTDKGGPCPRFWETKDDGICDHWCCHSEGIGDICYDGFEIWTRCKAASAWDIFVNSSLIPLPVDWDGDQDIDLIVASCSGDLQYWRRDGASLVRVDEDNPFSSIHGSGCLYPEVNDWDGDGDLDLLLGRASGRIDYYENIAGEFHLVNNELNPLQNIAVEGLAVPCAVDWDGDLDVDLLVGNQDGTVEYFERTEQGSLVYVGPLKNISVTSNSIPRALDWNFDGEMDLLLVDGQTGHIQLLISETEDKGLTEQYIERNPFHGLPIGGVTGFHAVDLEKNGQLDLIVGTADGGVKFFQATDHGTWLETNKFNKLAGLNLSVAPQAADYDGDGFLDIIVGETTELNEGTVHVFLFNSTTDDYNAPIDFYGDYYYWGELPTPHMVDWDRDGDLDIIVANSPAQSRFIVKLRGFPWPACNTDLLEQTAGTSFSRGKDATFLDVNPYDSSGGEDMCILAHCSSQGFWFISFFSWESWEANREGACTGAVARKFGGIEILDQVGNTRGWEVLAESLMDTGKLDKNIPGGLRASSDGSPAKPHCNACSDARANPECGCQLSVDMASTCATELCRKLDFDVGFSLNMDWLPREACTCVDNDAGASDMFGTTCSGMPKEWCGHYDHSTFNSSSMCCICGGGLQPSYRVQLWAVQVTCYKKDMWLPYKKAHIAGLELHDTFNDESRDQYIEEGHIQYYLNIEGKFFEASWSDNPFRFITVNARTFPSVVDFNGDGLNDLFLGTDSRSVETVHTDDDHFTPPCAFPLGQGPCLWDDAAKARCAKAFCARNGYTTGTFISGWGYTGEGNIAHWETTTDLCLTNYSNVVANRISNFIDVTTGKVVRSQLPHQRLNVTARCQEGGAVLYFQQQADGTVAQNEEQNPFRDMIFPQKAIVQMVDFDLDNELEVLLSDGSGTIRYFKFGTPCDSEAPCNRKGNCHTSRGFCVCNKGHSTADCSGCDEDFYSKPVTAAQVPTCHPCPGKFDRGGMCVGRGTCMDNAAALIIRSKTGNWTNTTSTVMAHGSGDCVCSPHFGGRDELGRISCMEGLCPAGHELKPGQEGLDVCSPCEAGYSKQSEGNGKCEACQKGYFTLADGATACEQCPGGRSKDKAGKGECKECPKRTFSQNASLTCEDCPIGRYADKGGMMQCLPCIAGRWSKTLGMDQCTPCAKGTYGLGSEACQPCIVGTYADGEGSSSCALCSAGHFGTFQEVMSSSSCQPCARGRWSNSVGARSEDSCISCGGGTTRKEAATNSSMCIQPTYGNFTCISSRYCSITITGTGLEAGKHKVAITPMSSRVIAPGGESEVSDDGVLYKWGQPLTLAGGTYEVWWCLESCEAMADFNLLVGQLALIGPTESTFTCVRGRGCENLDPISGVGLMDTDAIQVFQRSCGNPPALQLGTGNGRAIDVAVDHNGAIIFGFGPDPVTVNRNAYPVCWCAMGRGLNGSQACSTEQDFNVPVGYLNIEGAQSGHEMSCWLGQPCIMSGILGAVAGDRLMVKESCSAPALAIEGVPGDGIAETADGKSFHFLPLESQADATVLMSVPGLYSLCFCRPSNATSPCTTAPEFVADAGLLQARGPFTDQSFYCSVGDGQCDLKEVAGTGLENGDEISVRATASGGCVDDVASDGLEHPAGFKSTHAAAHSQGTTFSLGAVPSSGTPGKYLVCWRPSLSQGPFRVSLGFLYVACPAGTYRLQLQSGVFCEDCPLGFFCAGVSDDTRTQCSDGRTTLSSKAKSAEACLCQAGFRLVGAECEACPAGEFKRSIGNNETCPEKCPEGTTSKVGARSAEHCYSTAPIGESSSVNSSRADVFVVQGELLLPACLTDGKRQEATSHLRQLLADLLQVLPGEVVLELPESPPDCSSQNGTATQRRLQGQDNTLPVRYKVNQAIKSDAERLTQNVKITEIQASMQQNVGINVIMGALPSVSTETLECATKGEGMSFPLGSRPTSLDECTCSVGYERDEAMGRCVRCDIGLFKGSIGADQPCTLCKSASVSNSSLTVRLTTAREGADGEHLCTCPTGYTSPGTGTPPDECVPCGKGYYCEASRRRLCPEGSTTQIETAGTVNDCICLAGYFPSLVRNKTHRCQPCQEGYYKEVDGDTPCVTACPVNAASEPGARSSRDCFCQEGYFFLNSTSSCQVCPPDGVVCKGGFDPPSSRYHAEPSSQEGYFMTGFAHAEECYIENEDGQSVCLEGATRANESAACDGFQTGALCGACMHLSARDLGDEPCEECEENVADWMHVAGINLDLLIKAAFGIFLGKQAMDSATKTTKMEAVILRIMLQWNTASSVLASFDLSSIELFHWSQENLSDFDVAATARGLSFKFQFPEWFRSVWRTLTAISASIPTPVSPQVSLECLLQRQQASSSRPSFAQLFAPALWWFLYPVSVTCWVALLCLIIAKVLHPWTVWLAARAKRRLQTRLSSIGISRQSVDAVMADPKRIHSILADPSIVASDQALVETLGGSVYAEAAASVVVDKAGAQCLEMLQQLRDDSSIPNDLIANRVQEVLEGGLESLSPFLQSVFRAIDREKVSNLFSEPLATLLAIRDFLQSENSSLREERKSQASSPSKSRPSGDALDGLVPDMADDEEFGEEVLPDADLNEDYTIFGLFRNDRVSNVLKDAFPLYAVTMYSIWDTVTTRMLGLLQVKTILITESNKLTSQERRWLYDMRLEVFKGDHLIIAVVGILGLALWSVGILVTLFTTLRKGQNRLQERTMIRNYGYFYNGLEPNVYWWEVLVKKVDILLLYIVTFTELFHDPRAKLIMYLGLAGVFWAAHNMYHPYDNRQNRLADRIEDLGLGTRFTTILVLQMLLMLNAGPQVNAIMAIILVVINARFMCTIAFVLGIEIPNAQDEEKSKELTEKAMGEVDVGGSNPITAAFMRIVNWIAGFIVRPIIKKVLRVLGVLANMKQISAHKVPHIQWQGVGLDIRVITHEREKLPWHERVFSWFFSHLYQLADQPQKSFVAHSIGQFWDYVLNNSECQALPACIMDIFLLLPGALKEEREVESPDPEVKFFLRVARRIRMKLSQIQPSKDGGIKSNRSRVTRGAFAGSSTDDDLGRDRVSSMSSSDILAKKTSFKISVGIPANTYSGEDFNAALLFIQRLPKSDVHSFIMEAEPRLEAPAQLRGSTTTMEEPEAADPVGRQYSI